MKRITIHNPANLEGAPISAIFPGDEYKAIVEREEVQLVDPTDQDITYAEVLNVWVGPLAHVPAMLLEMSSDPLQRTFAGAHMHLVARRPEADKIPNQETVVSVLVLRPKASTLIRPTLNDIKRAR
tara:strand:+ start:10353 stop:10730 length:378 start_codon:yes stop_codon:yes gene_type:complete